MDVAKKTSVVVAKTTTIAAKIIVVIVARSQLRLMDVAKNFASSNKIQLRLQLPLIVQFH